MMPKSSPIIDACRKRLSEELRALRSHRSSGSKVIGYTCHAFPASVAAGLGCWPVRLLCGSSSEAVSAAENIIRPDICPLVKSLIGNVSEERGLHGEADLWAGLYTCDGMRRGYDVLSEKLGKTVYTIQLPSTRTVSSAEYYAFQIGRLVSDMEIHYGRTFDRGAAADWQRQREAASAVLSEAALSGKVSPCDLHAMFHLFFVARPLGIDSFFREIMASSPAFRSKKRVVLTGSPLTSEDTGVLEILEERGIAVIPLNCSGLNAIERENVDAGCDNLPAVLARSSFYMPTCMRTRPNSPVYENIAGTIEASGASGLIVKCLKFCDHWYTERERIRRTFGLPVLVFDSDYAGGGRERTATRLEAFLETLE